MPHVKGNKFKPKLPEPSPTESQPEPATAAQPGEQPAGGKKKKNKNKFKQQQDGPAGASDVAVEPAVPAAAAAPADGTAAAAAAAAGAAAEDGGQWLSKKQRKQQRQQQQQQVLPAVPTVVVAAPKPGAAPSAAAAAATSNWAALKAAMDAAKQQQQAARPHWHKKRKAEASAGDVQPAVPVNRPTSTGSDTGPTKVLAIDCEMVGVGPNGDRSVLARVCIVNSAGNVLLDRYVRPKEKVTDFRTRVSGIRPSNLRDAAPFDEVQRQVADLLKGRIVVGHAIVNDLEALLLSHKRKDVRDTARYPPLMKEQARTGRLKPRALRHLAAEQLGLTIQEGEHSPVDDARAALLLYMRHRKEWERWVAAGGRQDQHPAVKGKKAVMSLEELAQHGAHLADL
ncbi:RNA exonuclease 4 [Chlorella sorokiniana]|uniref:RNA exonuclease 4 n=1 Tax=Chlorella sorokiniana TaxID=3076 RepID=A0A2P6TZB8_CHLSO|nr:RNA exonuclease 4 [Chlorella sorokiniana]|eukprot:PRW59412.1 RNA exonuclease 4 [Chlorella sorokiniana]